MINLLPPEHKQKNRLASLSYAIALVYIVVGAGVFLGAAALVTYNLTASADINGKQDRIAALTEQNKKNKEISDKANFIQDRISSRGQFQEGLIWEKVLDAVAAATPTGVQLKSLRTTVDKTAQRTTLSIQGNSPDRRSVLLFQSKLSTDKSVSSPLIQSLNEVTDKNNKRFDFTIEMGVQTDAIKK